MSSILDLLEPEEFVGSRWHRLTRNRASLPRFPGQACAFRSVAGALPIFHHALGGDPAVRFAEAAELTSHHRLGRGLRLMLGEEKISIARRNDEMILVPQHIDCFDDAALNRRLYFWLAAFFVDMKPAAEPLADPLARDVDFLRRARDATMSVLRRVPAFEPVWRRMCESLRRTRPARPLPEREAAVEAAISKLLGGDGDGGPLWTYVVSGGGASLRAGRGYRPFLPVACWGEFVVRVEGRACAADDSTTTGKAAETEATRRARRSDSEQAERKDYLALNRFEKLLTLVESLNINRAVEDDDEDGARRALDDAEELRLAAHSRKASTRLKVELEMDRVVAVPVASAQATYPEWDYRRAALLERRVTIRSKPATGAPALPFQDARTKAALARVRRSFEAFRPGLMSFRGQLDGPDLDLEAVIRGRVDIAAGGSGCDGIYLQSRRSQRDLSVAVLVDSSLSTEAAVGAQRVIDIEQEALVMLSNALSACGDEHGLFAFSSRRQSHVAVEVLKEFTEPLGEEVMLRVAGLRPRDYTRLGAAVRYGASRLVERPHGHRLLILLTDGKPNDVDHYEGRFGIEDTRHAVLEARSQGVTVFAITIDSRAQDYFPVIFGQNAYAIVRDPAALPAACLSIYRMLVLR